MLYQSADPRGWDNDNYMDALNNAGKDEDAIERANDEYFRKSRYGRPDEYDCDDDVVTVTTKNYDNNNHNHQQQQQRSYNQQQYQQQQQHQQQSPPTSSFPPNDLYTPTANTNLHTNPMTSYADSIQLQQQYQQPQPQPQQTSSYNSYSNPGDEVYDDTTNADALVKEIGGTSTVAGAPTLTDTMKEKAKSSHNDQEAAAQGGSRFMELMQRSQDQQYKRQQQSQSQQGNTITITTPTMIMTPEEIANLSIEGQARLYREFYYTQQQQQQQGSSEGENYQQKSKGNQSIGSTSTNYLQRGVYGFDGRKIGRNKDGDIIANTSDEYFAKLKRDSTTRNIARYSGNEKKANEVFHDPSIQDIKHVENPYLKEQRQQQMNVLETIPDEMLVFQEFSTQGSSTEDDQSYSGISYKNRMKQIQEAKRQQH
eukprot:CAMPEP_0170855258 /NCGR_PEP_ID=MMETSP0734-20130129/13794_1 /TAXON_ID=186038 /ORGANISM="Fragilariopsis kerguelensis, Strain L26-C5" /LENGTH=424 /DNA_ID=CAMNT_0011226679 /DNA_START=143 /DNA_END=1417 /DNA_ORIENTATION=-